MNGRHVCQTSRQMAEERDAALEREAELRATIKRVWDIAFGIEHAPISHPDITDPATIEQIRNNSLYGLGYATVCGAVRRALDGA